MHRRTFVKLGMFACLPVPDIRQGISMDLMRRACDPSWVRYDLSSPFVEDGNAVATDGKVAVVVFDRMGIANKQSPVRLPPVGKAFEAFWHPAGKWLDWPSADYTWSDYASCYYCNGRGFEGRLSKCSTCIGEGIVPADLGKDDWNHIDWDDTPTVDCKKCVNGFRSNTVCRICKGTPYVETDKGKQVVSSGFIAAGYHHLVSQFPGVQYSEANLCEPNRAYHGNDKPVLFRFEGGRGALMPLDIGAAG